MPDKTPSFTPGSIDTLREVYSDLDAIVFGAPDSPWRDKAVRARTRLAGVLRDAGVPGMPPA